MTRNQENYIRACVNVAMDDAMGYYTPIFWVRKNGHLFYFARIK